MVVVAGHLIVAPSDRETYLAGCAAVVRQALNPQDVSTARLRAHTLGTSGAAAGDRTRRCEPGRKFWRAATRPVRRQA